MLKLEGLMPPLPTPTTKEGELNIPAVHKLSEYLIGSGVTGLVANGGVGEYTALTPKMRVQMVAETVKAAKGRVPVIGGIITPALAEAIEVSNAYKDVGADAVLVTPPFYHHPTQAGIRDYFKALKDKVELPIILYDCPHNTHLIVEPKTIAAMLSDKSLFALKASNKDLEHFNKTMALVGNSAPVMVGETGHFPTYLSMGGCGGMIGNACLMPKFFINIYNLVRAGRLTEAYAEQRKLFPLTAALSVGGYFPSFKQAFSLLGIDAGEPLLPLSKVSDQAFEGVRAAFRQLQDEGVIQEQIVLA